MVEKEGTKRIQPSVMQVALLDEIAERLMKLQQHQEESRPEGIVEPLHLLTVSTRLTVVHPVDQRKPWFSVTIVKLDEAELNVIINTEKSGTTPYVMGVDENVYDQHFSMPMIHDVMLSTNSGTCRVKVRGSR